MTQPGPQSPAAKGAERRERLLAAATRYIARNGARGTTLAQIARTAGVSQSGLIYHYGTKEDLLHAVLDKRDTADATLRWGDDSPGLQMFDHIVATVRSWSLSPDAVGMHSVLVAENAGQQGSIHDRLLSRYWSNIDSVADVIAQAQERGEVRKGINARRKAVEIVAFINGLETAWLLDPSVPAAETAEQWARDQVRALRAGRES